MSAKQERNGRKFGETGRAITAVLQEHGISGYVFSKTKHAWVTFEFAGRQFEYHFPCSPRDDTRAAKQCRRQLTALLEGARG